MFYAHFVLSKKGPLAKIWLAAHWDKKLTKAHVFETNIESSVEGILQPKVKMALRTSGHLLLGIVRIYSRKAKYLLADCNEAFIKIKMAFRPGIVDLPEGNREAAVATITLPEVFHDFDTAMPDITIDMDAQVSLNQSRAEDITLKEDYGTLSLMADDGFEDMPFEPETGRDGTNMEDAFDPASLLLGGDEPSKELEVEDTIIQNTSTAETTIIPKPNTSSLDVPLKDDGFGGAVGEGLLDAESGALFEPAGLFDDAPLGEVPLENTEPPATEQQPVVPEPEKPVEQPPPIDPIQQPNEESSDDDMYDMAPGSIGAPSPPSSPETPPPQSSETDTIIHNLHIPPPESTTNDATILASDSFAPPETPVDDILPPVEPPPPPPPPAPPVLDHTTLLHNEDESFALAPLDTTISHGPERTVKAKRKRKLIVDEIKNISGEEMKSQLSDTTDIVTTLDLAPPTKRLMQWKETGGVEKLFALPGYRILSRTLSRAYQRHLTTRSVENEDFDFDDRIDLDAEVEQAREDPDVTGMNARKKQCRESVEQTFPQDLHIDSLNLETSRPSYASDHNLTHPSLDMQSFLPPPHQMFPPPPDHMMGNMLQPPPAHMMQHIMGPDMNQLSQIQNMMHPSMIDQGPPLHTITPTIQNENPPDMFDQVFPPSEHIHHASLEKAAPNHPNDMDEQTLPHDPIPEDINSVIENDLHHPSAENLTSQPHIVDGHGLHSHVDEDATQPCAAEDYNQNLVPDTNALPADTLPTDALPTNDMPPDALPANDMSNNVLPTNDVPTDAQPTNAIPTTVVTTNNAISNHDLPMVNHVGETGVANEQQQSEANPQEEVRNDELNDLFDSLHNGDIQHENNLPPPTENELPLPHDDADHQKNNELPVSDDEDDYGAPGSVGPVMPEEQMADETYEQFEERILSKRTTHMLHIINNKLDQEKNVNFSWVVKNNKRKQVAQKFYTFLVLKKLQAVELEQNSSYGVLIITKGPKFEHVYNSN